MIYAFIATFTLMIVAMLYVVLRMTWTMLLDTSLDFVDFLVSAVIIGSALFLGLLALGGLGVAIENI